MGVAFMRDGILEGERAAACREECGDVRVGEKGFNRVGLRWDGVGRGMEDGDGGSGERG
jgi:hypothetical protein